MSLNPHRHVCDIGEIDYSEAEAGKIVCKGCERTWLLGEKGWTPNPVSRWKPGKTPPVQTSRTKFKPYRRKK